MHICLETDYAVRVALYLALRGGEAEKGDISREMHLYSHQLQPALGALEKMGIVKAGETRCRLTRDPSEISLLDIVTASEGEISINRCMEPDEFCSRDATKGCPVRRFYSDLQDTVKRMLKEKTLAQLV